MSINLDVFVQRSSLLSPLQWREAVLSHGFPVELPTDFDVDGMSGFLPCLIRGVETGFEYSSGAIDEEVLEDLPEVAKYDFCISFKTRLDDRDWITSVAAAGVLSHECRGLLLADDFVVADEVLEWTRHEFAEFIRQSGP